MTTTGEFTRRVFLAALIVAAALLVWKIASVLMLAFFGILIAIVLRSLAEFVHGRTRIPVRWCVLIVIVWLLVCLAAFIGLAGGPISNQWQQFVASAPRAFVQIKQTVGRYAWGQAFLERVGSMKFSVGQGLGLFSRITGTASTALEAAADIGLVFFTAIYFSLDPDLYKRGLLRLVPPGREARAAEVVAATGGTLRRWLMGQLVGMLAVGVLTTLGLWIVGVPLALFLGVLMGLLDFVPIVGPIGAAVPGILIALTNGWRTGLYALIVYVAVQQIENHAVTPLVQKQAVHIPPAFIILAVVALGLLFGLPGVLVATPLTAVASVWIKMLYVEDVLGRQETDPAAS